MRCVTDIVPSLCLTLALASVIRDTVYLDGGNLFWQPGFADGHTGSPQGDGGYLRHMLLWGRLISC